MSRHVFPSSLGDIVAADIEKRCCHGPGDIYGAPVRLTDEEHSFLEAAYAIDTMTGRRKIDAAAYSRRKGTRKSELGAWLVVVETTGPARGYLDDGEPVARSPLDPLVLCTATTEDQGDLVYGAFRSIVKASDALVAKYDVGVKVTYLKGKPGSVELKPAGNPAALDGDRPTFQVADEPHLWVGPTLAETFAVLGRNEGKRKIAQPWTFYPTTAYAPGENSIAEILHKGAGGLVGQHVVKRLLFDHWQASTDWDLTLNEDGSAKYPDQLRAAIIEAGRDAYWGDTDGIAGKYETGLTTLPALRRYWLNIPYGNARESWLPPDMWEGYRQTGAHVDTSKPFSAAIDMGLKHDTCSLRAVQKTDEQMPDGRSKLVTSSWEWVPKGVALDIAAIELQITTLHKTGNMTTCAYDPAYFERSAQALAAEGVAMEEFSQGAAQMVPACGNAYEVIVSGRIKHDDTPLASSQVTAAVQKTSGEGWRLTKSRTARINPEDHNDSAIALVMAIDLETQGEEPEEDQSIWFA